MSSKHRSTLAALFEDPVRSNILWKDVVSLFEYLGANVHEAAGSRVRVTLGDEAATFHRPHPQKETRRYAVRNVRKFLSNAGVEP